MRRCLILRLFQRHFRFIQPSPAADALVVPPTLLYFCSSAIVAMLRCAILMPSLFIIHYFRRRHMATFSLSALRPCLPRCCHVLCPATLIYPLDLFHAFFVTLRPPSFFFAPSPRGLFLLLLFCTMSPRRACCQFAGSVEPASLSASRCRHAVTCRFFQR